MKDTDKITLTVGQLKRLIVESKEIDLTNPDDLISFIKMFPKSKLKHYIFRDGDKWVVTNEWLCGTFAGKGFEGDTPQEAAEQLINYFNTHIGHHSMVGNIITKSGWPNLQSVKSYLKKYSRIRFID